MNIDIQKAFTYIQKDVNWVKKWVIGSLLIFIPTILSSLSQSVDKDNQKMVQDFLSSHPEIAVALIVAGLLSILLGIFVSGYTSKNVNTRIWDKDAALPEWKNWGSLFFTGFKLFCGMGIYIVFLAAIGIGLFLPIAGALHGTKWILVLVGLLYFVVCYLLLVFCLIIAHFAFLTDLKFVSFFNFKLIGKIVNKNLLNIIFYILLCLGLHIMSSMLAYTLMLTVIGVAAMPFVYFYVSLISADLAAQVIANGVNPSVAENITPAGNENVSGSQHNEK